MKTAKERIQARKLKQNFERNPPLCLNCKSRVKIFTNCKGKKEPKDYCNFGKFPTSLHSVCDKWMSIRGETIRED